MQIKELIYLEIREGRTPQHELLGYIEDVTYLFPESGGSSKTFYIKNKFLKEVGFVTKTGGTYRYVPNGENIKLGEFTLEEAVRRLLNFSGAVFFQRLEEVPVLE